MTPNCCRDSYAPSPQGLRLQVPVDGRTTCAPRASEAKDTLFDCMEVMLFSALSLEAFLNHLGPQLFQPSPREKLDVMLGARGKTVDFARRPYQSFNEAFQLRNALARAETGYVPFEGTSPHKLPMCDWMKMCD